MVTQVGAFIKRSDLGQSLLWWVGCYVKCIDQPNFIASTTGAKNEPVLNMFTAATTRYLWLVLMVFLMGYGTFLAWQEWLFRQSLEAPVFTSAQADTSVVPGVFNPAAIVTVLGLSVGEQSAQSTETMELRASFVSSQGQSHALLDDGEQAGFYTVGERLPGGSVLRRVEVSHVVLWRNGREEHLALKPAAQYLLPVANSSLQKAQAASLHLRPIAEQP